MTKYDFDFENIEEMLYNDLGIANPTDIMSLKLQYRNDLDALKKSIEKKNAPEAKDKELNFIYQTIDDIAKERDINKILTNYISYVSMRKLTLDYNVKSDDTDDDKKIKIEGRNRIFAITSLIKSVPDFVDLIKKRKNVLEHIDLENRIVNFDKQSEEESLIEKQYPKIKLNIDFDNIPAELPKEYRKALKTSEIYVNEFGEVTCQGFVDKDSNSIIELIKKKLVAVIKKDEFGEMKKYSILMDEDLKNAPAEFIRDVLFSDIMLRNSKNNLNYIGSIEKDENDSKYGFKVVFNESGLEDLLRGIYFEKNDEMVKISSNNSKINSIEDAFSLLQEKMNRMVRELQ